MGYGYTGYTEQSRGISEEEEKEEEEEEEDEVDLESWGKLTEARSPRGVVLKIDI